MRRCIAGPVKARVGDNVRVSAIIAQSGSYGRCYIYSRVGRDDPSPHVQANNIGAVSQNGKQVMVSASSVPLSKAGQSGIVRKIRSDISGHFYIMQEVDLAIDPASAGRIIVDGKPIRNALNGSCGWLRRNIIGRIGGKYAGARPVGWG